MSDTPNTPKRHFRPDELSSHLGVSKRMIYRLIQTGGIRAIRVGHLMRIPAAEYERVMREGVPRKKA